MRVRGSLIRFSLLTIFVIMFSCQLPKNKVNLVTCEEAYSNFLPVDYYRFDESKCKVINVFGHIESIDMVLSHTPPNKINRIIEDNPDFEFIFYLSGVDRADSVAIREKLIKYNMSFPIFIDYDGRFASINNFPNPRLTIGYITDRKNRVLGSSVIGTQQSFFDSEFANAKRKLGK